MREVTFDAAQPYAEVSLEVADGLLPVQLEVPPSYLPRGAWQGDWVLPGEVELCLMIASYGKWRSECCSLRNDALVQMLRWPWRVGRDVADATNAEKRSKLN